MCVGPVQAQTVHPPRTWYIQVPYTFVHKINSSVYPSITTYVLVSAKYICNYNKIKNSRQILRPLR
jgi:hypothetical protein